MKTGRSFFLFLFIFLGFLFLVAVWFSSFTVNAQGTFSCNNVTEISKTECEALVALYNNTNGPNWRYSDGWLNTNTPCSWYGITCDFSRVMNISLDYNHLSGSLPPELGNLTNLQSLSLHDNQLSGSIPPELGNLTNLGSLDLSNNQLSGSIPPELGNLTNLQSLSLYNNQLSGSIPPGLGNLTNLQSLSLDNNQLSGSIPPELGNLTSLGVLGLSSNQLTGSIPPELGNLSLGTLDLSNNQLSGNIPSELGNLVGLDSLYLNNNQLSGRLPSEWGNFINLYELDLSNNLLSGALPQSFTKLYLGVFYFNNTDLCEPSNYAFQEWLHSIWNLKSTHQFCSVMRGVTIASVRDAATGSKSTWLQKAKNMRMPVVHIPLAWQSLEVRNGEYEWEQLDDILRQVKNYGLRAILRVYHAPPWHTPFKAELTAPPTDPQTLYNFMYNMVSHIEKAGFTDRVVGYVIWNEPNIPEQWGGNAADPAHYMALLKAAYQGAKAANPDAIIVSAPLAPTATGNGAIDDLTYLAQLYDQPDSLADYVDYVGMNGLGFQYDPDYDTGSAGYNFTRLKYLHDVMVSKGDTSHQVWVLETGWLRDSDYDMGSFEDFKVSERQQAEYLARAFHKAETEWPDWLNLMVVWNLGYDQYYSPTSNFYWYSIADTLAEVYLTPMWTPEIQTPMCGTTSDDTPTIAGIAPISSTVAVYVDGITRGTTIALESKFSNTLSLSSRPAKPYTIQVQADNSIEKSQLSRPLTLTVNSMLPFNPLGTMFTWQYGRNYTAVRQPRDSKGCINPDNWRLPQLPWYRTITVTVPVNKNVCASPSVELIYLGQVISDFMEMGNGIFQTSFVPPRTGTGSFAGNFNLRVTCGNVPYDFGGTVALIDPEGVVYDAKLGPTAPISQATVTLYKQNELIDWAIWDAWNYPYQGQTQTNPQVTVDDGYYSFMVPAGSYVLRVTADGYAPYESDPIQVITEPIHLNIPLILWRKVYLPVILKGG